MDLRMGLYRWQLVFQRVTISGSAYVVYEDTAPIVSSTAILTTPSATSSKSCSKRIRCESNGFTKQGTASQTSAGRWLAVYTAYYNHHRRHQALELPTDHSTRTEVFNLAVPRIVLRSYVCNRSPLALICCLSVRTHRRRWTRKRVLFDSRFESLVESQYLIIDRM